MKDSAFKQLFEEFPEISAGAWEERIRADLKGADYQKKLIWKTEEGIDVKPYYREEDLQFLQYLQNAGSLRKPGAAPNSWLICQDIDLKGGSEEANLRIREALKGGAQAIRILLKADWKPDPEQLDGLLEGIPLGETEISFRGTIQADLLYDSLVKLTAGRGIDPTCLSGSLGADPLGVMAETGIPVVSLENLGLLVKKVLKRSPSLRVIPVNGALLQNAGATLTEELGFALSMANEYMALLTSEGIDPADAAATLQLDLCTGTNYFMEIAKIRAARILWGRICEGYGIKPGQGKIHIHAASSLWNMTLYDPHVNLLRGTTEAMAAVTGGADWVSILPFELPSGKSSLFSDRMARNTQIILREEAYFDRVADPASGSYYLENLTDALAGKAWELFLATESGGGFREAFESGWVQEVVDSSLRKKKEKATQGRLRLLGTNAYPAFNELVLANLDDFPFPANRESQTELNGTTLKPIRPFRLSSLFEEVRLQTEKSGKRPRVFLFKYGDPRWVTARAMFSGNFFACAGYEIPDQPVFKSIRAGIKAARDSAADLVVLCSSDDAYAGLAPKVHDALGEKSLIVVAGYPEDSVDELRKTGITHFIHVKTNMLESLQEFNSILLKT